MAKNLIKKIIGTALIGIGLNSCNLFINNAPVMTVPLLNKIYENESYICQIQAYDPEHEHLDYSIMSSPLLHSSPEWSAPLSVDSSGLVTGVAPEVEKDTEYNVKVDISDGVNVTEKNFILKVENTN